MANEIQNGLDTVIVKSTVVYWGNLFNMLVQTVLRYTLLTTCILVLLVKKGLAKVMPPGYSGFVAAGY